MVRTPTLTSRPDSSLYKGGWLENNMHGKGVYISKEGKEQEAEWFKGQKK